jgi:hypothetical protein
MIGKKSYLKEISLERLEVLDLDPSACQAHQDNGSKHRLPWNLLGHEILQYGQLVIWAISGDQVLLRFKVLAKLVRPRDRHQQLRQASICHISR